MGTWFCVGGCPWPLTSVSLLPWQEDEVVLQCITNVHKEQRKFCLAAEGLGNRLCFLEPTSEAKVRLSTCLVPSPSAFQTGTSGVGMLGNAEEGDEEGM